MVELMPRDTPKGGHFIQVVTGEPDEIIARGVQLTGLGTDMDKAATLLKNLVENGAEMRGDAIEKLKELSESVHGDLKKGAALYAAVAPYITSYGSSLSSSQTEMKKIIGDLHDLWDEYQKKQEAAISAHSAQPDYPTGDDADDETLRKKAEEARDDAANAAAGLASDARDAWNARAGDFDDEWDSWHKAFTRAADGIHEDMAGKIEDSWNDDFGGFLKTLSDVLAVAGMILAVLALVVGGPLVMALAAIVAVATLVVAVTRAVRGEGDWIDVAFGVIGVIPFVGPAARGLKAFQAADNVGPFFTRLTNAAGGSWALKLNLPAGANFSEKFASVTAGFFTGKGLDELANLHTVSGWHTAEVVGNVFSSVFSIAGGAKDTAGGAWPGAFDSDHNLFG